MKTTITDYVPGVNTLLLANTRELAKMLGVSVRHVERLDSSGRLPKSLRLGRAKRWVVDDIKAWLRAGCPDRRTWTQQKEVRHAS